MADPITFVIGGTAAAAGVVGAVGTAVGAGVALCTLGHTVYKDRKERKKRKQQYTSSNTPTIIYVPVPMNHLSFYNPRLESPARPVYEGHRQQLIYRGDYQQVWQDFQGGQWGQSQGVIGRYQGQEPGLQQGGQFYYNAPPPSYEFTKFMRR